MYPINSSLTAKTVNQYSSNNLYYTGRDYTVKATNQSYRDYTSSASLRWTFNTSSNSWN